MRCVQRWEYAHCLYLLLALSVGCYIAQVSFAKDAAFCMHQSA